MVRAQFFRKERNELIEKLFRVEEVAPQVGLSKNALYAACREKQFPHVKIGTRVRIPESGLRQWIEQQMQIPKNPASGGNEAVST